MLLNNELDDFAAKPGVPNAYGLIGGDANAPGPGKRPLSSMTPTIVLKNGRPFIVTGSPGGSRIITAVLQILVNTIDRGMPAAAGGGGAAHPSSMVAGPGVRRERAAAETVKRAGSARPHGGAARPVHRRPTPSSSPRAASSAPPTSAPAARWRRGIRIVGYGQRQFRNATDPSDSGNSDCTTSVLIDSASAPASDTTVATITDPPNTSCCGLSSRLK